MHIKRFEADDMTEALRLVKRECGDEAVILAAKEVRPGGFFSALRKKRVEITAATDYPMSHAREGDDFSGLLSQQLNLDENTDRVSLSSSSQDFGPLSREARTYSPTPPASAKAHTTTDSRATMHDRTSIPGHGRSDREAQHWGEADGGAVADGRRRLDGQPTIAEPFYRDAASQKIIALVGPCGVGKTTTVAKLAWHCQVTDKKRTGLISLDRFRIGANGMLSRIAQIMNLPLRIVHDDEQLKSALNELMDIDVVLIDTPGMNGKDPSMMVEVRALLRLANPDETHLVANATVRDDVFEASLKTFAPLGVDHLLLTHMDEQIGGGVESSLLVKGRLPASFYADGVDLSDGLRECSADKLAGLAPCREPGGAKVTAFSRKREPMKSGSASSDVNHDSFHYVANRNSELFHHPTCKSVRRINAENIAAFNSTEHAIREGFKPCRACCDMSMIGKPMAAGAGYRRACAG